MRSRSRIPVALVSFAPLCVACFFLASGLSPASAQLLGAEFQVNSYTTDEQSSTAVAAADSGDFVVVWESRYQDGSTSGVTGQRFDSAGSRVGGELQVNTFTTDRQAFPAVATDGTGSFVVAWQSNGQDGSVYGVFGQRYDAAGSPVGSELQVNSYTTSFQMAPAMVADGSGNFVVVWQSYLQDASLYGVFGQRFDSAGSKVGGEFQVNTYATSAQDSPAVAANATGSFVVAWESYVQDGSNWGVFGQRFDSAGSSMGSEFRVNSFTTGGQKVPAVAADGAGNFVVTWSSNNQDGSNWGIFAQRFDAAGLSLGSEFQVNSYTTSSQYSPAVASDTWGNFVVTWQSHSQDGVQYGVFGQRFDAAGGRVGSEFQINSYTTSFQGYSAAAADGSGNFVVVWQSQLQDGSSYGVFGQRLSNWIFLSGFESADVCAWSAAVGSGDVCPP